jgi:transposase
MCRCASASCTARSRLVIDEARLKNLDAQQLREVVRSLMGHVAAQDAEIQRRDREIAFKQATIDKITHEMAVLKRLKFAAKSEHFNAEQKSLLEEAIDADLEALQRELEQLAPEAPAEREKRQPKREKLPENLPRREIRHEPASTTCTCGCPLQRIGQDVAEKLDYQPGVFSVERHIRGKWVCAKCETLVQAPVPAHIIDKGIPTTGLLAQVLVAKYVDHQPLYRQESIFGRAGLAIPRSTLAQWVGACGIQLQPLVDALKDELLRHSVLHADETPVAMLKPGNGKTHRAYLWSWCTGAFEPTKAVVYDFADSRAGRHRLQGAVRQRHHRSRLPGTRAAQVLRPVGQPQEPDRRRGTGAVRQAVQGGGGRQAPGHRAATANTTRAIKALGQGAAHLAAGASAEGARRLGNRQGHRLQPQPMGSAGALHRRRHAAGGQQLGREPDPADRARALELVVRRITARGPACCRDHEPGALGAHQRARSLRLPARCARALANAARQPHRRVVAASLASAVFNDLSHIAALIEAGGDITLGHLDAVNKCVATASDDAQCLAMLVRRKGESLDALLRRLDAAISDAYENEHFIDEINAPVASGSRKPRR